MNPLSSYECNTVFLSKSVVVGLKFSILRNQDHSVIYLFISLQ